jgi:hypothetical protein
MGRPGYPRAATAVLVLLLASVAAGQRDGTTGVPKLPALSMTCPHHPDVIESRPGTCPFCKMALVPVRLDSAWMCPVHSTVMSEESGTCRICRRPLTQVRVSLTWTCLSQPGIDRLEPGKCPDGSAMIPRRTLRPHGNHNPQHGGQFFMAPDNWHHLEGTYPRDRVVRLYLYDDYARPLSPSDMKRVAARIVTRETFDPATRKTTELTAFPLRVSRDAAYLEARVDRTTLPAEMTAKVRIKPDGPEYRFDFTFHAVTKDPAAAARPRAAAPSTPARAAAPAAAPQRDAADAQAGATPPLDVPNAGPVLAPVVIPDTMGGIIEQLKSRDAEIREFIRQGNFAAVWVPAFQAKDLAVALEPHLGHLSPAARELGEPAIHQVVRLAWLLDAFGDVGNRQQLEGAYASFAAAVGDVAKAFSEAQ